MSADATSLMTYPLRHRAPQTGKVGHEVIDARGDVVAMMTFRPDEQERGAAIAQMITARLNRAQTAAAGSVTAVQDDLWHLIDNVLMHSSLAPEERADITDRVRTSVGSFFSVDRDPPTNVEDPDVTALAGALRDIESRCDKAGLIGEAAQLRGAAAMLQTLNAPHMVVNEFTRNRWRKLQGYVDETCTYLTRMASDPKRAGKHAVTLRQAVATIRRLVAGVVASPAAPDTPQDIAA